MSVRQTIETYDRIADGYSQRWKDRSVMARAVARFTGVLEPGATVLDVGCGPGFDCVSLRNSGLRVFGMDLSWGMLRAAREHYSGAYMQADMRRLPFSGGVDGVWCNAALLHLSRADARHTLGEFHRVLKNNGILYLALKEGQGETQRSETYGPDAPRYFTYWQAEQLDATLQESGFTALEGWIDEAPEQRWVCRLVKK